MRFRNHADLPHFSRGLGPEFIRSGLKSTQKSPLTPPSNSELRTNRDKFESTRETEIDRIEAALGSAASQFLRKLGPATAKWAMPL